MSTLYTLANFTIATQLIKPSCPENKLVYLAPHHTPKQQMNAPAHNVKELTVINSPFKKLSSLTASLIDMHPCGILTVP